MNYKFNRRRESLSIRGEKNLSQLKNFVTRSVTSESRISRHDDFVLEAAGGDDEEHRAHEEKGDGIDPEMHPARAAEDDAAGDVDEISGGDEVTEDEKEF